MANRTTFIVFEPSADVRGTVKRLEAFPEVREAYAVFNFPYGDGTIIARAEGEKFMESILQAALMPHIYPGSEHIRRQPRGKYSAFLLVESEREQHFQVLAELESRPETFGVYEVLGLGGTLAMVSAESTAELTKMKPEVERIKGVQRVIGIMPIDGEGYYFIRQ